MKRKLNPYTDKIAEPLHDEPNGEHVGHFRIIIFDQHNAENEIRFGVDIALEPEQANQLAVYIAKDDRLYSIIHSIFSMASRQRLSNSLSKLIGLTSNFKDENSDIKIPDGMTPQSFAVLMREAFNGEMCNCPECLAVREKRIQQSARNTDPASN